VPGGREVLISLFERHFIESQEATGMTVIGQFRDLNNPDRFVWLRGFADMVSRAQQLEEFYGGPIWKEHREAANATMIDSDNVLLLRPARTNSGFCLEDLKRRSHADQKDSNGLIVATIYHLSGSTHGDFLEFFEYQLASRPLPVREGVNVFVSFSHFADCGTYEQDAAIFTNSMSGKGVAEKLSTLIKGPAEVLLLAPTFRSLVR
jgi:hypothetical protein